MPKLRVVSGKDVCHILAKYGFVEAKGEEAAILLCNAKNLTVRLQCQCQTIENCASAHCNQSFGSQVCLEVSLSRGLIEFFVKFTLRPTLDRQKYSAGVAKLANARDLKSRGRKALRVQFPSPA